MDKEIKSNDSQKKNDNSGYHKNHKKKHYYHNRNKNRANTLSADDKAQKNVHNPENTNTSADKPEAQNAQNAQEEAAQKTNKNPSSYPNRNNRHRHNRNRNRNKNEHTNQNENLTIENDITLTDVEPELAEKIVEAQVPTESLSTPDVTEIIENKEPETSSEKICDEEQVSENAEDKGALAEIIGIRFKAGGKTYYFAPNGIEGKKGKYAIVETARGLEFGEIVLANSMVHESEFVPPLRPVVRLATEADIIHHDENIKKQDDAFKICNEKIIAHGLDMKLIDAQYTFDNSKLLFYFTSSGRVDFRELVKDLASVFKTRIELRQIGIRDEAKIIGGLGICGRSLCCSVFLSDFGQVSIKMAKEQNLSLNSSKISGACGRLMCCLRYEYDTYAQEIKNTPPVDSKVKTADGIGTVTEISPLAGKIKVRLDDKPDQAPKTYMRDDVAVIPKQK